MVTPHETMFICTNPTTMPDCTGGICKGMVMMFLTSVSLNNDKWFPDLSVGRLPEPGHGRDTFYTSAHKMHITGHKMAVEAFGKVKDADRNERALVPTMYLTFGLKATELTGGYVASRLGRGLSVPLIKAVGEGYRLFHVSLRAAASPEAHSVAVWYTPEDTYVLFEPNGGCYNFLTPARFGTVLASMFAKEAGDEGGGPWAGYGTVCCWGLRTVTLDEFALPPPPLPPGGPRFETKAR